VRTDGPTDDRSGATAVDQPSEGGPTGSDDGLDIPMDGEPTLLVAPGQRPEAEPGSGLPRPQSGPSRT
jgi:hypothetical protein